MSDYASASLFLNSSTTSQRAARAFIRIITNSLTELPVTLRPLAIVLDMTNATGLDDSAVLFSMVRGVQEKIKTWDLGTRYAVITSRRAAAKIHAFRSGTFACYDTLEDATADFHSWPQMYANGEVFCSTGQTGLINKNGIAVLLFPILCGRTRLRTTKFLFVIDSLCSG